MIDIHSHILPKIDDGARTIEESIMMAKLAVNEGISTIIATPHHMNGEYKNDKEDILDKVQSLNGVFQNENIPLQVLPGQEVRIYGEMLEDLNDHKLLTLNNFSSHLLIEFPSGHVPRYAEKIIYECQIKGIVPIIVHPERNRELAENPNLLYEFVKKGALTQITAGSVVGKFGKNVQSFSKQLIKANLTHFVASDAHNIKSRRFHMSEAMDGIQKEFGIDYLDLFLFNGDQVIQNKSIHKEIPKKIKKKKFLGLF